MKTLVDLIMWRRISQRTGNTIIAILSFAITILILFDLR